jgi:hypothetical protein
VSGTISAAIPSPGAPLVDADGNIAPVWRAWLLILQRRTGGSAGVSVGEIEAALRAETAARLAADSTLTAAIGVEATHRAAADNAEVLVRAEADLWLRTHTLLLTGGTLTGALVGTTASFDTLLADEATIAGLVSLDAATFTTLPTNAANDAAAATAGVPVGGVYRNGSVLMVRVV